MGNIRLLLLAENDIDRNERGFAITDKTLVDSVVKYVLSTKPPETLIVGHVQGYSRPTDEEELRALFPQEPPQSEPPPVQQQSPKSPPPPPPPIRTKNVDVAKETEAKPVGV